MVKQENPIGNALVVYGNYTFNWGFVTRFLVGISIGVVLASSGK